jgi:hypothetical protein
MNRSVDEDVRCSGGVAHAGTLLFKLNSNDPP